MDLGSGRVVVRPKITPMVMTNLVKNHVEDMARKQGLKSMKFYNRKRQEMVFTPIDLLEGVDNQSKEILEDEDMKHGNYLPPPVEDSDLPGGVLDSDDNLDVDEDIDEEEVADLLDDSQRHGKLSQEELVEEPDGKVYDEGMNNNDKSEPINCGDGVEEENLNDMHMLTVAL